MAAVVTRTISTERLVLVAAVAVLVLGSAFDLNAFSKHGAATVTRSAASSRTSTNTGTSATGAWGNASGIDLRLAVNSTSLHVGQSLNVSVSLFNTLPAVNLLAPSGDWPFQGVLLTWWGNCEFPIPLRALVVQGNFTLKQLQSIGNFTAGLACAEAAGVDQLRFRPESSLANVTMTAFGSNETFAPQSMSVSFTSDGYWNATELSQAVVSPSICPSCSSSDGPSSAPFTPGIYTIGVADEWGQAAVLHFTITN